jgi:DNA-binding NarL/FixJ family response regulator
MEIQMHSIFFPIIVITLIIGLLIIIVFLGLKLRALKQFQSKNPLSTIKPLFNASPREKEVLDLICKGFSNKEIAMKLGISEQTVKNHVSALMEKSCTHSRTQLAIISMQMEIPGHV